MNIRFIYLLRDPNTEEVRYIGQTSDPEARFNLGHRTGGNRIGKKRMEWIGSLTESGQSPIMEVIEQCPAETSDSREFYWILRYALDGARLTNAKFVPGGKYGYKVTGEHREGLMRLADNLNLSRTAVMWLCLEYAMKADPKEILASILVDFGN